MAYDVRFVIITDQQVFKIQEDETGSPSALTVSQLAFNSAANETFFHSINSL